MERIAYNALAARPRGTGVQTYIRELLAALDRAIEPDRAEFVAAVQADSIDELPVRVMPRRAPVSAGLRRALQGLRAFGAVDLVHGLDVDLPLRPGAPSVSTIHDLAMFDVPWTMSRRKAFGERMLYRLTMRKADALIAVSAFTAERIEATFGRAATVIHEGAPTDLKPPSPEVVAATRAKYALPERFVFHIGTRDPRKDIATVAAACTQAGVPLVLAGPVSASWPIPAGARSIGYVSRDELPALYDAATVTALCSRYEGFGLPPLEAMACGGAVIAARASSVPEVVGDAGVLVAPGDVEGWATAIKELANDASRRDELAAAGARRAATFTWDAAARQTIAVYRSLGVDLGT